MFVYFMLNSRISVQKILNMLEELSFSKFAIINPQRDQSFSNFVLCNSKVSMSSVGVTLGSLTLNCLLQEKLFLSSYLHIFSIITRSTPYVWGAQNSAVG
jgi:hypothetical protein